MVYNILLIGLVAYGLKRVENLCLRVGVSNAARQSQVRPAVHLPFYMIH